MRCRDIALAAVMVCVLQIAGLSGLVRADDNPFDSIVGILADVPADARTARSLGIERQGGGVVIDDSGLVLTIGYIILEADQVWVVDRAGTRVAGEVVAYDHDTGFGLVRALDAIEAPAARLGRSRDLRSGHQVVAVGPGGGRPARVMVRRPFAGGWEYLLETAIFTSPPIPNFGGAALFDSDGRLVGIGSLIVGDTSGAGEGPPGNMFVPVDLLPPILGDLLAFGHATGPVSPWLGVYPEESGGALVVSRVSPDSPAAAAGLRKGDIILGVGDEPVAGLETLWRRVRAVGPAGVTVPLKILSDNKVRDVALESRDRRTWLKLRRTY